MIQVREWSLLIVLTALIFSQLLPVCIKKHHNEMKEAIVC